MNDLYKLEFLCNSATQGNRKLITVQDKVGGYGPFNYRWVEPIMENEMLFDNSPAHRCGADLSLEDAELIQATGPSEIRALINRIRVAEAEVERLKKLL